MLIGNGGYKGPPDDAGRGMIEIGYSVVSGRQRRGYATEACRALVDRAFADRRVEVVVAHTLPHLEPSIGVMRKLGMSFVRRFIDPTDGEVVRYELTRAAYDASR